MILRWFAMMLALAGGIATPVAAAPVPVKITLSIDETPIVPMLAEALGYFALEGIEIEQVRIESFAPNDFEMQRPMRSGHINAAYHWFHHAVFGARHGLPVTAVMMFNDAPGMTVFVENGQAAAIRSPGDFRGRTVASGAGYGTKSLITHALGARHGLKVSDYRPVFAATQGREAGIMAGLGDHTVDVVTSEEPLSGTIRASGLAKPLIDLTTGEATRAALGAPWPAQSLLMSPGFMAKQPRAAQRLVNAFVRTMRWIETHSAEEIAAHLPPGAFASKDKEQQIVHIRAILPGFARRDYRIPPAGARLMIDAIAAYPFDASESGLWRAAQTVALVNPRLTYDNRMVERAMARIR